jgi:hypothetical protein
MYVYVYIYRCKKLIKVRVINNHSFLDNYSVVNMEPIPIITWISTKLNGHHQISSFSDQPSLIVFGSSFHRPSGWTFDMIEEIQKPWLVGGLEYFIFFNRLGIIIPTDFHIFFQRVWNHQPGIYVGWFIGRSIYRMVMFVGLSSPIQL